MNDTIRRCGWWLLVLLACVTAPRATRAQDTATRFEVANVGDSTVAFRLGGATWVRPGMSAMVIDPRRRDALVARLRVLAVTRDSAVAVITGQAMLVVRDHIVLLTRPGTRFFRTKGFWSGLVTGLATGFIIGKL